MKSVRASKSKPPTRRKSKLPPHPRMDRTTMRVFSSFEELEQREREETLAMTPVEWMQVLELMRQVAYGYGPDKPLPRFQRVLEIVERA